MRYFIAILTLACSACQPSHEVIPPKSQQAIHEPSRPVDSKQRVYAFGGMVIGDDMGEFGGGISFTEPNGTSYQLVDDNSHGIFNTAHGVLAITGLAHLSINRGAVYLLSRQPGKRVVAKPTMRLPGAPCNDMPISNGNISLRVFTGIKTDDPSYRCFLLQSPSRMVEQQCEPTSQGLDVCFG